MKLLKSMGMPKFKFTWATVITLFRGLAAVVFLVQYARNPVVWLAFWIGAMEMLDVVDGWVARRFNQGTDFGRWLDAVFDKAVLFGVLGVLLWYLRHETLVLYVIVALIIALDATIARVSARKERRGIKMKPTRHGKYGMFLRNTATVLMMMYVATSHANETGRGALLFLISLSAGVGLGLGYRALQSYRVA